MWKITISSAPLVFDEQQHQQQHSSFYNENNTKFHLPDTFIRERNATWSSDTPANTTSTTLGDLNAKVLAQKNRLSITSTRVCSQDLVLPENVHVVCADSAAADLSSSAMFTLNKVPYLFSTACSDGIIRFWSCKERKEDQNRFG